MCVFHLLNDISYLSVDLSLIFFAFIDQAAQVKIFVDDLCKTGKLEGLRYTYWNESFTSKVSGNYTFKEHGLDGFDSSGSVQRMKWQNISAIRVS